jgi:hypothetical protein
MDNKKTTPAPAQPAAPAAAQPTPQMQALNQIAENTAVTIAMLSDILQVMQSASNAADALIKLMQRPAAAAQQPAASTGSDPATFSTFVATELIMGYTDDGQPTYKLIGTPWTKYGIKVWPEVLPTIDIDVASLRPGRNTIVPVNVKALNGDKYPKKVIGPADLQAPTQQHQEVDDMPF